MNEIADHLFLRFQQIEELLGDMQDEFHEILTELLYRGRYTAMLLEGIIREGSGDPHRSARKREYIESDESRLRHIFHWRRIIYAVFPDESLAFKRIEWMRKMAALQTLADYREEE